MERKYNDPRMHDEAGDHIRGISMMRMFEYDKAYRDLIVREPYVSLAEAILGEDCHMMSQKRNTLRARTGRVDGIVTTSFIFRCQTMCPDTTLVSLYPASLSMSLSRSLILKQWTMVQHRSSPAAIIRDADHPLKKNPTFEGKGPVSFFTKAGGAYMFNSQVLASWDP